MPEPNKHKNRPPCSHMEPALNEVAEGSASKLKQLFVWLHVLHCSPCRKFLESLKQMLFRLQESPPVQEDEEAIARLAAQLKHPD